MFLNIMTSLSFCLCHLFIKDIWDIQCWGHITLQLLLYSVWQSTLLGTGREKILLSLFLLSFFSPLFSFHKIHFFFSPHLWIFQLIPFFSLTTISFRWNPVIFFFLWKIFTTVYGVWITDTPSLFQVVAAWQCFEKPQQHQSWWQTEEDARSENSLPLSHVEAVFFKIDVRLLHSEALLSQLACDYLLDRRWISGMSICSIL